MTTTLTSTFVKLAVIGLLAALMTACDPFAEQRKAEAEQKRIECLDHFCQGDVEPKRDMATEVAFKKNGQWYIGLKEYGSPNFGAISFFWPSKAPTGGVAAVAGAQEVKRGLAGQTENFYEIAIEIFLTGRARWPEPKVERPWENADWERRFEELLKQGLRMERLQPSPDLQHIRFFDAEGKQHRHEYFLAIQQRKIRGSGMPGIACDLPSVNPNALPRCNGAEFWKEDVYADFRFHAKHAQDWPAIHQEIVRVLNLTKRVTP